MCECVGLIQMINRVWVLPTCGSATLLHQFELRCKLVTQRVTVECLSFLTEDFSARLSRVTERGSSAKASVCYTHTHTRTHALIGWRSLIFLDFCLECLHF